MGSPQYVTQIKFLNSNPAYWLSQDLGMSLLDEQGLE